MSKTEYPQGPSERTTVKRLPELADYDRETIDAILDATFVCHVGFVDNSTPFVIPSIHARVGDTLYFHGSPASRMLRLMKEGAEVSVSVTLVDSIVVARSAFNSSLGFRSALVIGEARVVDDPDERVLALAAITNAVLPGRWDEARPMQSKENKGTLIVAVPIEEYSAKVSGSEVDDEDEDYDLPVWAGAIPLKTVAGEPQPDPRLADNMEVPDSVRRFVEASQ